MRKRRQFRISLAEQPSKGRARATCPSPGRVPSRSLPDDPVGQELAVSEAPPVGDPRGADGLATAGVKGQQRGDGGDHVGHGEALGVRCVELDGDQVDAALGLAGPLLDQGADEGVDGAAGRAPGRGPEGEQRGV